MWQHYYYLLVASLVDNMLADATLTFSLSSAQRITRKNAVSTMLYRHSIVCRNQTRRRGHKVVCQQLGIYRKTLRRGRSGPWRFG